MRHAAAWPETARAACRLETPSRVPAVVGPVVGPVAAAVVAEAVTTPPPPGRRPFGLVGRPARPTASVLAAALGVAQTPTPALPEGDSPGVVTDRPVGLARPYIRVRPFRAGRLTPAVPDTALAVAFRPEVGIVVQVVGVQVETCPARPRREADVERTWPPPLWVASSTLATLPSSVPVSAVAGPSPTSAASTATALWLPMAASGPSWASAWLPCRLGAASLLGPPPATFGWGLLGYSSHITILRPC